MPNDRVLDIGAGCLRIGWWLLQYIEPSNYHAIETVRERLDTGADALGLDIHRYYNDDWEFPDLDFDFVLARSIWTHASKPMIEKMLAEFAENSRPGAVFLTSMIPARTPEDDYMGLEWIGKVHKSDPGGLVMHSFEWVRAACAHYGLAVDVGGEPIFGQTWLVIRHASDAKSTRR